MINKKLYLVVFIVSLGVLFFLNTSNKKMVTPSDKILLGYELENSSNLNEKIIRKGNYIYYSLKHYLSIFFYIIENKKASKDLTVQKNENNITRLIAHAGGSINNYIYTDSLEALNYNYKKGFRYFELDIRVTSDGVFVAVHDWDEWKLHSSYNGSIPPTLKEFKKHKLYSQYTMMDIDDINQWFTKHRDAHLITDKTNQPKIFSEYFIDKSRLSMELFSWKAVYEGIKEGVDVMPTWSILSSLHHYPVAKLLDLNINKIAANRNIYNSNKSLLDQLLKNGIHVYAYNIKEEDVKVVICEQRNYFYGIYLDKLNLNTIFNCQDYN